MSTFVESIRYLWKQQLDKPFDAGELRRIKDQYDRQIKMDETHRKLYEIHREAYYRDRDDAKKSIEAQFDGMSKQQVAVACGFAGYSAASLKRLTIHDMIDIYIWSKLNDTIKSDHDRVKEHWSRLTDAQKLGEEPFDV